MRQTGTLKLLIAEDQAALRRVIEVVVAGMAGEIRDCGSAKELVEAFADWEPDFVLMDAEMRALDAITTTRSIKVANPSAKVIIVSGYDSAELREATIQAGAVGYVMKEDLLEIGRLLEGCR